MFLADSSKVNLSKINFDFLLSAASHCVGERRKKGKAIEFPLVEFHREKHIYTLASHNLSSEMRLKSLCKAR